MCEGACLQCVPCFLSRALPEARGETAGKYKTQLSLRHQISGSHLTEELESRGKGKGPFPGNHVCFAEGKKARCCNIFQDRIVSHMKAETWAGRRDAWGSEAGSGRRTPQFFVGVGSPNSADNEPPAAPRPPRAVPAQPRARGL